MRGRHDLNLNMSLQQNTNKCMQAFSASQCVHAYSIFEMKDQKMLLENDVWLSYRLCCGGLFLEPNTPLLDSYSQKVRTDKRMVIQQEEQQWSLMLDNCDVLKKKQFLISHCWLTENEPRINVTFAPPLTTTTIQQEAGTNGQSCELQRGKQKTKAHHHFRHNKHCLQN